MWVVGRGPPPNNSAKDDSGKSACPNCNEEFNKDDLAPDHYARRQILKAVIYCPNKDHGCVETFSLKELQHLESCPVSPVTCLHHARGCATKLMRKDFKKHLQTECEHRVVGCQFCKLAIPHSDIEDHKKSCQKLPASCPNDCGLKTIPKDMTEKHLHEDCPQQEKNCKYQRYGCEFKKHFSGDVDKFEMLEEKMKTTADKNDVRELRQLFTSLPASKLPTQVQLTKFEREMDIYLKLSDQDLRYQLLETASYDGVLLWKISGIRRRKQEADSGKVVSLYSQPFYTSQYGYKMCARIYLNGDGMGKGTHVSLFFVVMKGDYDALLQWPFNQKVTMTLLDQETGKRSITDSIKPDGRSSSFKRPTGDTDIVSAGCPLFVAQQILKDSTYVREDTMFIKMIADTSDLYM
ncbi:TNF receptor-associated factor 3-like [Anneissia japonica]|uniref:TNF receptor-associated factor 3-like n=1 Tax=Anneissia japonica TaxID=1529436 RepID=UPI0014258037|nr:TNF receptor-associated factor 3-like [Anneissia japonica]